MIYLRCPFCDEVSGWIEGSGTLVEPYPNYYSCIDTASAYYNVENICVINGLKYFPHEQCYEDNMNIEERRKKVFGPGSMVH